MVNVVSLSAQDIDFLPLLGVCAILVLSLLSKKVRANQLSQVILALTIVGILYLNYTITDNKITITEDVLIVKASSFSNEYSLTSSCSLEGTFSADNGYNLSFRNRGIALINYKAGHFTLKDGKKVFVLITNNEESANLYKFKDSYLMLENSESVIEMMSKACNL